MNILSYNLWLTSLSLRVPPHKKERIVGFIENLKNHQHSDSSSDSPSDSPSATTTLDVIALQEMFTFGGFGWFNGFTFNSELRSLLVEEANKIGYEAILSDPPKTFMQDSGLLILTKHQVLDSENYIFQYASYSEYVVAKGILYALIKKNDDHYLLLFTVHMDAHRDRSRREQIKELVEFVKKKTASFKSNYPQVNFEDSVRVVICGDYNTDSLHSQNNNNYSFLKDTMDNELNLENVFGNDENQHPVTFPIPIFNHWCLDHVFVSKQCVPHSYEVVKWKATTADQQEEKEFEISDHHGVMTSISF